MGEFSFKDPSQVILIFENLCQRTQYVETNILSARAGCFIYGNIFKFDFVSYTYKIHIILILSFIMSPLLVQRIFPIEQTMGLPYTKPHPKNINNPAVISFDRMN